TVGHGVSLSNSVLNQVGTPLGQLNLSSSSKLMALLKDSTPDELKQLLLIDPALAQSFWDRPPDSADVAAWWASQDDKQKQQWCDAIPGIIGNLGGIPYTTRSQVNMAQFLKDTSLDLNLPEKQRMTLLQLKAAIRDSGHTPFQLIDYNLDTANPKVALAYGDLDTAQTATWMAPGMDFNAYAATQTWGHAARNLLAQQRLLDQTHSHAVVAWLGYNAPDTAYVLGAGAAQRGATRFASELDSMFNTRAVNPDMPPPLVSVTAHSYGTTVAADALTMTKHQVSSFVMVGSAGLDGAYVKSYADLHVGTVGAPGQGDEQAVYTTNATKDGLAPLGAQVSRREQPNPQFAGPDSARLYGAQSFSSDGDHAEGLEDVRGHNPIGNSSQPPGLGNANPSSGHGYYDSKTQSLRNIAAATIGEPDQIDGGTSMTICTPTEQ
ncbi:MAG: alpha/beta hydrolase, partial [Leifsonia sp.]